MSSTVRVSPVQWHRQQRALHDVGMRQRPLSYAYRVDGPADASLLLESAAAVVLAHDCMRYLLPSLDDPHARVGDPDEFRDCYSYLDDQVAPGRLRPRPLGLAYPEIPLWNLTVRRLKEDCLELKLDVDHYVFDGFSERVFLRQLQESYRRGLEGRALKPERVPSYADWSQQLWQRFGNAEARRKSESFWRADQSRFGRLAGLPVAMVPVPSGTAITRSKEAAVLSVATDRSNSTARGGFQLCLAAVLIAASMTSEDDSVQVGCSVPNLNRHLSTSLRSIGYYAHWVNLNVQVDKSEPLSSVVAKVVSKLAQASAHAWMPLSYFYDDMTYDRFETPYLFVNGAVPPSAVRLHDDVVLSPSSLAAEGDKRHSSIDVGIRAARPGTFSIVFYWAEGQFADDYVERMIILVRRTLTYLQQDDSVSVGNIA